MSQSHQAPLSMRNQNESSVSCGARPRAQIAYTPSVGTLKLYVARPLAVSGLSTVAALTFVEPMYWPPEALASLNLFIGAENDVVDSPSIAKPADSISR